MEMSFLKLIFLSLFLSLMCLCHHISATPLSSTGVLGTQHKAACAQHSLTSERLMVQSHNILYTVVFWFFSSVFQQKDEISLMVVEPPAVKWAVNELLCKEGIVCPHQLRVQLCLWDVTLHHCRVLLVASGMRNTCFCRVRSGWSRPECPTAVSESVKDLMLQVGPGALCTIAAVSLFTTD